VIHSAQAAVVGRERPRTPAAPFSVSRLHSGPISSIRARESATWLNSSIRRLSSASVGTKKMAGRPCFRRSGRTTEKHSAKASSKVSTTSSGPGPLPEARAAAYSG
jgi:hypothetical protein